MKVFIDAVTGRVQAEDDPASRRPDGDQSKSWSVGFLRGGAE